MEVNHAQVNGSYYDISIRPDASGRGNITSGFRSDRTKVQKALVGRRDSKRLVSSWTSLSQYPETSPRLFS
jgi:hypothetical protein